MHHIGRITEWNDDRGFGFVESDSGGVRTFIHVNDFTYRTIRPSCGMRVKFKLGKDMYGRQCAVGVCSIDHRPNRHLNRFAWCSAFVGAFILTAIVLGANHQIIPLPLAIAYILMSVLAIGLYGKDKFAAKRRQWRTSEGSLHIVGLLGGWPGAMLAQGLFHHKTAKVSFRLNFWLTVVLNCVGFSWLATQDLNVRIHIPEATLTQDDLPRITPLQR